MSAPVFPRNSLFLRDSQESLCMRANRLRPASIDEATRSFEAVLATDVVTFSFDAQRFEPVLDAYPMEGFRQPDGEQIPLLDSHNRFSIGAQLGSLRNFRVSGSELLVRGTFASTAAANDAWTLVREGHARDLSAGFLPIKTVRVAAGTSQTLFGREWTAPADRDLLLRTEWSVKEGSITPIGQDTAAKIRSGAPSMNPFLEYLHGLGLTRSATDAQAWAFYHDTLTDAQRAEARALLPAGTQIPVRSAPPAPTAPAQPATLPVQPEPTRAAAPAAPADEATIRANAATAERTRIARIQELAGADTPAELTRQAVSEGWTPERFSEAALQRLRDSRSGGQERFAGGVHSRSHERDCTEQALQAGFVLRRASHLVERQVGGMAARASRLPQWLTEDVNGTTRQQVLNAADEYRALSYVDVCRECVRITLARGVPINVDGQAIRSVPLNHELAIRAAMSTSVFLSVFSTSMNLEVLAGYEDAPDSTDGWCNVKDDPNFKLQEAANMTSVGGGLKKHGRGGDAEHAAYSDSKETYRIARYSQKFVVDEMDLIDDSLGAIEDFSPMEMGAEARRLRPDLVYAILLANANLQDGVALFHATHNNTASLAFSAANLEAVLAKISKQRVDGRPRNLRGRYVIVPQDLKFAAAREVTSALRNSGDGDENVLRNEGLTVVADDRIGLAGVTDPSTGTAYAGSATNWFVSCRAGESNARTIRVAYRAGTNRQPQTRSGRLENGQWGVWWDINLDIGAKALDFVCLQRGNV